MQEDIFTPRDIVELIADLAFLFQFKIRLIQLHRIYDGANRYWWMLTVGEQRILELAKKIDKKCKYKLIWSRKLRWNICYRKSWHVSKGEGRQADNIEFGSTISQDRYQGETLTLCYLSTFGTAWKSDLETYGVSKKKK